MSKQTHLLSVAFESIPPTTSTDVSADDILPHPPESGLSNPGLHPICLPVSISVTHTGCSSHHSVNLAVSRRCQNEKYDISLQRFLLVQIYHFDSACLMCHQPFSFLLLFCLRTKCDNHYYMSKGEQLCIQVYSGWDTIQKSKYTI